MIDVKTQLDKSRKPHAILKRTTTQVRFDERVRELMEKKLVKKPDAEAPNGE